MIALRAVSAWHRDRPITTDAPPVHDHQEHTG